MVIIEVYAPIRQYFNKWGERIQDWDEYGQKNAFRTKEIGEEVVYRAYGSDEENALRVLGDYARQGYEISYTKTITVG